ncbi:MAG: DNA repair protein RecN [Clostridia bacterium]
MLCSLYIENIALIPKLNIDFSSGLTVLTGETGGGKSIILDSLSLLCGSRSDKDIIRTGTSSAFVEGAFCINSKKLIEFLENEDIFSDDDGLVYISRRINSDGRSACKINGRNVPVSKLKLIGTLFMNIHGQQDTLSLADASTHLPLLDEFAHIENEFNDYKIAYDAYKSSKKRLTDLEQKQSDKDARLDILDFQINELSTAHLKPNEEQQLELERGKLVNFEKIAEYSKIAYNALYSAPSAYEGVRTALDALQKLDGIIPDIKSLCDRLENCKYEIADIAETIGGITSFDFENSPQRLDKIEERLMLIQRLERKYKSEYAALLEKLDVLKSEKSEINSYDELISTEKRQCAAYLAAAVAKAAMLTSARQKKSAELSLLIEKNLSDLDMPSVKFEVLFNRKTLDTDGADLAEFVIAPNKGEEPKPMAKIASGGELSRIMLSIKSAFSSADGAETVVFDEIDTGISGKTSEKVGLKLKALSNSSGAQILCVTHSAQIASLADTHLKVAKQTNDERTYTTVTSLDLDGRINEVARIMGGISISDSVLAAAKESILKQNL